MRIAVISYHTCPLAFKEGKETGGMNIYVLELSKALAKLEITVDIFSRKQNPNDGQIVQIAPNLRLIHIQAGPSKDISKKKLINFIDQFTANIHDFYQQQNLQYDLIHSHYYMSGIAGLKLKNLWNSIPLVTTFHTLGLLKKLVARTDDEQPNAQRLQEEKKLVEKSDMIISPSHQEFEYLQAFYNLPSQRNIVIPPGVNTKIFYPQDSDQAKHQIGAGADHHVVLFVGRIEPLKGIDVLIYALKIIEQRNTQLPVCLWIVGGDTSGSSHQWSKQLQRINRLVTILGLDTTVKFIGRKTQQQLPTYYNAADVVVMPSYYESFGMVALESLSCGVPVITTDVMGISSFIEELDKNLITSVNNPLGLAQQIQQVIESDYLRQKLQNNKLITQHFSWQNIAERILEVYKKLI